MDIIKKDKTLRNSLILIILLNIFFLITLFIYNDIILLKPWMESLSREYYDWYMIERANVNHETIMLSITFFIEVIFPLLFLVIFLHIVVNKKYRDAIGKKNIIISLMIGFCINILSFLFIKYNVQHYRLFMDLIPLEITSIISFSFIVRLRYALK